MRILYIADSFRPSRSACANRTAVLVESLRSVGHDIQVLASSDSLIGAPGDYEKPDYVTYFDTFPLEKKTLINRLRNNFGGLFESVRTAKGMGEFDVVVCTSPPLLLTESAMRIARAKRARLVLDIRDIWPDVAYEMGSFSPNSIFGRFFEGIARRGLAAADLVSTVSPGKVEKLRSRVPEGKWDKVTLVPNGIDEGFVELTEDLGAVETAGFTRGDGKICVYVGNIGLAQGLGALLDIASRRRDVRFLVYGKGADREKLEARAIEEGLDNVSFCGVVGPAQVKAVLMHADLTFIPLVSSRLRDSIPTKLYEALACGCPVLLAAAGDAVSLLEESGLGVSALPEDGEALLAAFNQAIDGVWTDEQRAFARAFVTQRHSRQVFARDFAAEIGRLSDGRGLVL